MQNENGTFEKVMETVSKIESEVSKHIIGQKEIIRQVLMCMLAGGNVLLEGMPGLGKTRLVNVLGKVMGLKFSRIQFTPDLCLPMLPEQTLSTGKAWRKCFGFSPALFSAI